MTPVTGKVVKLLTIKYSYLYVTFYMNKLMLHYAGCQKITENICHKFAEPKVTFPDSLFCSNKSPIPPRESTYKNVINK